MERINIFMFMIFGVGLGVGLISVLINVILSTTFQSTTIQNWTCIEWKNETEYDINTRIVEGNITLYHECIKKQLSIQDITLKTHKQIYDDCIRISALRYTFVSYNVSTCTKEGLNCKEEIKVNGLTQKEYISQQGCYGFGGKTDCLSWFNYFIYVGDYVNETICEKYRDVK